MCIKQFCLKSLPRFYYVLNIFTKRTTKRDLTWGFHDLPETSEERSVVQNIVSGSKCLITVVTMYHKVSMHEG